MKYIRTQKELYKVMQKQICNTDKFVEVQRKKVGLFTGTTELISKDDIIGQADTIEELCDAFVDTSELNTTNTGGWLYDEFDSKNKCLVYYVEDEKRTISLNEYDDLPKIYGAIWTEWGLKYVAKLNDKGDLELI